MNDRKINPVRKSKSRRLLKKQKVGSGEQDVKYHWAIDVSTKMNDFFVNKCLLLCTILGILQHSYFESNKKDKKYLYARQINSSKPAKAKYAAKILQRQLENLFAITKLKKTGPYNLSVTIKMLSKIYKCQFFIFDGISNSSGLLLMYPKNFNPELKPIYLYQPLANPDHIVFIKNIDSYYKANLFVCFGCLRNFKNKINNHMCKFRKTCFACRRFFESNVTYSHVQLKNNFCDKITTTEQPFNCKICNCVIYSNHCLKRHRRYCNGKGHFGYKCNSCNKFYYCDSKKTSIDMKNEHVCGNSKRCKVCHLEKEQDHLCRLRIPKIPSFHCRLAFFSIVVEDANQNNDFKQTPLFAVILREEEKRGTFTKYNIGLEGLLSETRTLNSLSYDYFSKFDIKYFDFSNDKHMRVKITEDFQNKLRLIEQKKKFDSHPVTDDIVIKVSEDFQTAIKSKQEEKKTYQQNLIHKFYAKLLSVFVDDKFRNTTYICNTTHSNALMIVLNAFIEFGICPKVIKRGGHILVLEIKEHGLRFLSSNSYLIGDECKIADQFQIEFDELFFPLNLLCVSNFDYVGPIPGINNFVNILDSKEDIAKKVLFRQCYHHKDWYFKKEVLMYFEQRLFLLTLSLLKFMREIFEFQNTLKVSLQDSNTDFLNPFNFPICSISGFVFCLYKSTYLPKFKLHTINNEYGNHFQKQVSQIEFEFCSYMDSKFPEKQFQTAFNNKFGQRYFKQSIPDLYSPITKEAIYLNGCFYHGHYNDCLINKNVTASTIHPFGKTYKEINDEFDRKILALYEQNSDEVKEVKIFWECQFREQQKTKPEIKLYFENEFLMHPLIRLRPRDAVRGAFIDVYRMKWNQTLFNSENFYCADINGLYSFCAINFKYMIGKYHVLIGKCLQNLSIVNNKFIVDGKAVMGAVLLLILPPQNLFMPFLLYRKKDGSVVNTLCKTCAECYSGKCAHSEKDRAFFGVYMISEIEFALQIGYKILCIYEIHYYPDSDFILLDYVQKINFNKTKYSNCLQNCSSEIERQNYCTFLNSKMNLIDPNFCLSPANCTDNKTKRDFFKLVSNSLFGKFIQRDDKNFIAYVKNQDELNQYLKTFEKIEDISCLNDQVCLLSLKKNTKKILPNLKQNVYIGSQITAFARQVIYEHMLKLSNLVDCKLYHVDCDCIFFSLPKSSSCPLPFSHAVGDFKNEYEGDIINYYSFGPKQYCISTVKNGFTSFTCKFSGLSLKSFANEDKINNETFELYLNQFIAGTKESMQLKQVRSTSNFVKFTSAHTSQNFSFSNKMSRRRIIDKTDARLATFPYGYKPDS